MMFSMSDLCHEVKDMADFLSERSATLGHVQSPEDKVGANMAESLASKIASTSVFSASDAKQLYTSLACLAGLDGLKATLQNAVDARIVAGSSIAVRNQHGAQLKPQLLVNPQNYLQQYVWDAINKGGVSLMQQMQMIIKQLRELGVRSLHEQTTKWCVACLLAGMTQGGSVSQWPSYSQIHEMVKDFKKAFDCYKFEYKLGYIHTYPAHPADLPSDVFNFAYPDAESPPVAMTIERWNMIGDSVILRSTNVLLRNEKQGHNVNLSPGVGGGACVTLNQVYALLQQTQSQQQPNILHGLQLLGHTPPATPQKQKHLLQAALHRSGSTLPGHGAHVLALQNGDSHDADDSPADDSAASGHMLSTTGCANAANGLPSTLAAHAIAFQPQPKAPTTQGCLGASGAGGDMPAAALAASVGVVAKPGIISGDLPGLRLSSEAIESEAFSLLMAKKSAKKSASGGRGGERQRQGQRTRYT